MDSAQKATSLKAINRAIVWKHTQTALAMSAGMSQAHVSALLRGDYEISAVDAIRLEQATETNVKRWDLRPDLWDKPKRLRRLDPEVSRAARVDRLIERQNIDEKRRRRGAAR